MDDWIVRSTYLLGALALICSLYGAALWLMPSVQVDLAPPDASLEGDLTPSFSKKFRGEPSIDSPFFALSSKPLTLQLPDLRHVAQFVQVNERPDREDLVVHISLEGSDEIVSVPQGEPLYLLYDQSVSPAVYRLSPNNQTTSLWVRVYIRGEQAVFEVAMVDRSGEVIRTPSEFASFTQEKKRVDRATKKGWQIGDNRVDGTLLARQRARWYGEDLFLTHHGGEEFQRERDRQRIDFGEDSERYSIFGGLGDTFVWDGIQWVPGSNVEETQEYPLLAIRSIDRRLMKLSLWDVGGSRQVNLNLIRSRENWNPDRLQKTFRFVGAKTRSQFLFELGKKRAVVSPGDWLVMTDGDWEALDTPEKIDAFVTRKIVGPLLIVERIEGNTLFAKVYNATRTDVKEMELSLQPSGGKTPQTPSLIRRETNKKLPEMERDPDDES